MPYADPEKRRASVREAVRRHRQARRGRKPKSKPALPELEELRFETARDVVRLLSGQVAAVLAEEEVRTTEKARVIGYLAGVLLRAVELGDLSERIAALERAFGELGANRVMQNAEV